MTTVDDLSARIKAWRGSLGLTQEQFARRAGISQATLVGYEGGQRAPGAAALSAIAKTGVNMNWLLTGEGEMRARPAPEPEQPLAPASSSARRPAQIAELLEALPAQESAALTDEFLSRAPAHGQRLRAERQRLGLSQDAFAALAKQSRKSQINYEKGDRSPDLHYLAAIAEAGADVGYILTGRRERPPPGASASDLTPAVKVTQRTVERRADRKRRPSRAAIGLRLREERARLGVDQATYADWAGASRRTMVEWERGGAVPNAEDLQRLAARGVDAAYVVTGRRASDVALEPFASEHGCAKGLLELAHLIAVALGLKRGEAPR